MSVSAVVEVVGGKRGIDVFLFSNLCSIFWKLLYIVFCEITQNLQSVGGGSGQEKRNYGFPYLLHCILCCVIFRILLYFIWYGIVFLPELYSRSAGVMGRNLIRLFNVFEGWNSSNTPSLSVFFLQICLVKCNSWCIHLVYNTNLSLDFGKRVKVV